MFFKIDHARRQKINGSRLFLKTTCVRELGVNDSWLNFENLDLWLYDSLLNAWAYNT